MNFPPVWRECRMSHDAFFRPRLLTSVYYPLAQLLRSFSHIRISSIFSGVELVDDFWGTEHVRIHEACPESKDTSRVGRWGYILCLLWQYCRQPWSFTRGPFSFASGRTSFVSVRHVWNGSAYPKSRQLWGAFRHTISQCKRWTSGFLESIVTGDETFPLVSSPKETSRWEKFRRRRWWDARRSHDVVQRAGGRLLWLGDTEAGSKV